jgi:thiamine biosynthesis lipoprotein
VEADAPDAPTNVNGTEQEIIMVRREDRSASSRRDGGAGHETRPRGGPDRREFLALGVGALAVATLPAALRPRPRLIRRRIPVMGTVAEVAIPTRNEAWAQRAIDAAFAELRRVDATMSRFLSDSDVGRLDAAMGDWAVVSHDTGVVLREALAWARRSDGSFDPCLGAAVRLWDVTRRTVPPSPEEVRGFARAGLWRTLDVEVGPAAARARLSSPLASVDLGGIAKGFAVDAAAEAMRGHGVADGLVNAGGDLAALGADAAGDPWLVGVRDPFDPERVVTRLEVADAAVATSGDYLRFFQHGGRRYHHLLDPSSGAPRRTPLRSLTVRADRCLDADAAATALYCAPEGRDSIDSAPPGVRVIHQITEVTT